MRIEHFVGWALVHSVWEGAAIAALLAVSLLVFRRATAQAKYLAALVALVLCVAAPIGTAAYVNREPQVTAPSVSVPDGSAATLVPASAGANFRPATPTVPAAAPLSPSILSLQDKVELCFPWILHIWLAGLLAMCVRLAGGLFVVERLKRRSSEAMGTAWQEAADGIAAKLGIRGPVELRLCHGIESPSVIGVIKATVLFPASVLTHLTTGQVEALLAHELAHIRRHDYVVNLVQSVIETVLFYHPAVWCISNILRKEREHCCDDLAIQVIGSKREYVSALASLEGTRNGSPGLTMAATGGSLVGRIKRILGVRPSGSRFGAFHPVLVGLALTITIGVSLALAHGFRKHQDTYITVHGQVLDYQGKPVPEPEILVQTIDTDEPNLELKKSVGDSNGRFVLSVAKQHASNIVAIKRGYGFAIASLPQFNPPDKMTLGFLEPKQVKVMVVDPQGRPVARLKVWPASLWGETFAAPELAQITDDHGTALFPDYPSDTPLFFNSADQKYALVNAAWYAASGVALDVKGPSQDVSLVKLIAQPAASLKGTVTAGGRPLSSVIVEGFVRVPAYSKLITTDATGRFDLEGFPSGEAQVQVFVPKSLKREWVGRGWKSMLSPGETKQVNLRLEHGGEVSGTVFRADGTPASQAQVFSHSKSSFVFAHTDDQGHYELRLPSGSYTLIANLLAGGGRLHGAAKNVKVGDGEAIRVDLSTPQPGAMTDVYVQDESGNPVPHANVEYGQSRWFAASSTDASGRATVMTDSAAPTGLSFRASWHDEFSAEVKPVSGQVRLILHRVNLGAVTGHVADAH